jgi:hypothetical protein
MRIQLHATFLAAALALFVTGCQSTEQTPDIAGASGTHQVQILRMTQGSDKTFASADRHLINAADKSAESLASLNADFTNESIVVISLGEDTTGSTLTITGAQRQGDRLFVQGKITQGASGSPAAYPFAAIVISKFEGTVHPEID